MQKGKGQTPHRSRGLSLGSNLDKVGFIKAVPFWEKLVTSKTWTFIIMRSLDHLPGLKRIPTVDYFAVFIFFYPVFMQTVAVQPSSTRLIKLINKPMNTVGAPESVYLSVFSLC